MRNFCIKLMKVPKVGKGEGEVGGVDVRLKQVNEMKMDLLILSLLGNVSR